MPSENRNRTSVTLEDRIKAVAMCQQGKSFAAIGRELNRSKSCIKRIIDRYNKTNSYKDRPKPGRPRISTAKDDRNLVRLVKKNRTEPSHVLANQWKLSNGKTASSSLVRKRLLANKLEWKVAVKKPRLLTKHIKDRKTFCKMAILWPLSKWKQVLFSDEMNIEVDNRKNRICIRRTTAEKYNQDCIIKPNKQGSGSIGIWCCMSYYGLGIHCIFDGRLNAARYIEILNNNLIESMRKLRQNQPFIFQQDNAPCHRAKKVVEWFADQKIEFLKWPANSPDLNCIENLWSWLDKELAKVGPRSLDELKRIVPEILENVPKSVTENLVDSMSRRINECLKIKGELHIINHFFN